MLKIEITEPHLMDKRTLHNVGVFLFALAGHEVKAAPTPAPSVSDFIEKTIIEEMNAHAEGTMEDIADAWEKEPVPNVPPPPAQPLLTPNQVMGVDPFPAPTTGTCRAPVDSTVDVDVHGLPWDGRIHARTKTKVADGSWKKMRGVHDHVVTKVEAELRQAMNAPAAVVIPPTPPVRGSVIASVPTPSGAQADVVEAVPSQVFAPPAAVPTPPAGAITFPALVQKIAGYLSANKLVQKELVEIVSSVGLPSLPLASTRPDLLPTIEALVDAKVMERAA